MSGATVQVGNVEIPGRVFLAPLAGFTDLPFRQICRKLGAAYAVAEMVASQKHLRESRKSQERFSWEVKAIPVRSSCSVLIRSIWLTPPAMRFSAVHKSWISTADVRRKSLFGRVRLGAVKR